MGQKHVKVRSTLLSPDRTAGSGPELITSSREWCDNGATTSTHLQNLPDKSCDLEVTPHCSTIFLDPNFILFLEVAFCLKKSNFIQTALRACSAIKIDPINLNNL